MVPGACLAIYLLVARAAAAPPLQSTQRVPDAGHVGPAGLVDEIAEIVDQKFYSPAKLEQVRWRDAVACARREFAAAKDASGRTASLRKFLATLETSHTGYYPRSDPVYWQWASLFEPILQQNCAKDRTPGFPIVRDDIGVFWKEVGAEWFVLGVFARGPADKAGLKLGDRVLKADGQPFSAVESFAGRAGKTVMLQVQRSRGAAPISVQVMPTSTRPHEELRQATADSCQILQHKGRRIGYIHMWSWATMEFQKVLVDCVIKSNAEAADGFILDIRDGWGGAHMNYLAIFWRDVPLLERIARDGTRQPFDTQIRKPAALLINEGTRSGKETVAYFAKKHHLARLVGKRTAGAVVAGGPICLSDGSLLMLAQSDGRVDGERLEGIGITPDVEVPFDFRYAAGKDAQLERALDMLAEDGQEKR